MPDTISTSPDESRQYATGDDHNYSLTIDEVGDLYAKSGHPCTPRTIQRYCAKGHLDARKVPTTTGDKYLVAPYSVTRHIAQLNEIAAFTHNTTAHDTPRQDTTELDTSRQVVTGRTDELKIESAPAAQPEPDTRYVEQLERENLFLREQVGVKDKQIGELTDRAKETNILIQGLQNLFLALQPARHEPVRDHAPAPTPASYKEAQPEQAQ